MSSSKIPYITSISSYDVQHHHIMPQWHHALFGRNIYTCTWYPEWIPLLRTEMPKQTLSFSLCRVGNCGPHAHTVTLSPRYFDAPPHQASQDTIYQKHIKNINHHRNVQLEWMVNILQLEDVKSIKQSTISYLSTLLTKTVLGIFEQTSCLSHI